MSNQIEQIRAEIERRISKNTFGAKLELIDILAWLDTLPSEEMRRKIRVKNMAEIKAELQKNIDEAKEIEGTPQEVTLIPSNEDEDEAAEMAARRAYPYEGGTKGDICEASIPIFCKGFKAGIAYERERLMKELGKELFTSNPKETNLYKMGATDEREWLMKEAVECEIGWSDGYRIAPADENSMNEALAKIGVLDQVGAGVDAKVSVIIIKKEK
ncbi:MAG: hypothetical protein J6Y20_04535 [Lachnospiraceae bacterium]|nr:hypothetical protein [Kiritimatiellia bacterium]MBP5461372.1 hypothetical protein [Lachnospiraceae bacterium]